MSQINGAPCNSDLTVQDPYLPCSYCGAEPGEACNGESMARDAVMLATEDEDLCLCDADKAKVVGQMMADNMARTIYSRDAIRDVVIETFNPKGGAR